MKLVVERDVKPQLFNIVMSIFTGEGSLRSKTDKRNDRTE